MERRIEKTGEPVSQWINQAVTIPNFNDFKICDIFFREQFLKQRAKLRENTHKTF